ncbi:ParA family protein [Glutamicibacter ardleyensis]|uniref:ParA family protein n=1 Tax=Glutamicibacter TaxID=1742989 RepID=UPI003F92FACB
MKNETVYRLTVGNLKGGVGRSTSAVLIALELARITNEQVTLIDADPRNGTTYGWYEEAQDEWPDNLTVQNIPGTSLARDAAKIPGHLVIDTGNDATILKQALRVTDHLLVPIAPTNNEAARLTPTLEVAAQVLDIHEFGLSILITRADTRSKEWSDMRSALRTELELPVMDAVVTYRASMYGKAYGTVPKKTGAYAQVTTELMEAMK